MTGYPIRDRLGEIACPALVVWGELDRLVPLRDAAEFEWLIPQARKVVYEDTGHLVMLERPDALQRRPAGVPRGGAGREQPRAGLRSLAK